VEGSSQVANAKKSHRGLGKRYGLLQQVRAEFGYQTVFYVFWSILLARVATNALATRKSHNFPGNYGRRRVQPGVASVVTALAGVVRARRRMQRSDDYGHRVKVKANDVPRGPSGLED